MQGFSGEWSEHACTEFVFMNLISPDNVISNTGNSNEIHDGRKIKDHVPSLMWIRCTMVDAANVDLGVYLFVAKHSV